MMGKTKNRIGGVLFIIFIFALKTCLSDFDMCNPEQSQTVFQFKKANCPFGVLFNQPITAYCMASTNEPEFFMTDLCDPDNYTLNTDERPFKIHLAFKMDDEADENTCLGEGPEKCNVTGYTEASTATMTEPGGNGCDPDDFDEEIVAKPDEQNSTIENDPQVANQTERLFKFMLGLTSDKNENGPNMRIVKMLKQSFRIVGKFCDTNYVPLEFGQDILQAFLFLFREADKFGFKDISVDDYLFIKKTLDDCENMEPPFALNGQICKTCSNVHSIEKNGKSRRYIPDEFSFQWGRYDVPVDATWGVLNFVHGLCYGNYRPNVNFHHLFQRESERLFLPPLLQRWTKPVTLHHEDLWDHIFSATVKNAMRNLDVCINAAYQDTPFLHRLERPKLDEGEGNATTKAPETGTRRRKRSLPTMLLEEGGLEGAGWCFQSEEDMLMTVEAYLNVHCPENKKVLDDLKKSLKEDPAEKTSEVESSVAPDTEDNGNDFEPAAE